MAFVLLLALCPEVAVAAAVLLRCTLPIVQQLHDPSPPATARRLVNARKLLQRFWFRMHQQALPSLWQQGPSSITNNFLH